MSVRPTRSETATLSGPRVAPSGSLGDPAARGDRPVSAGLRRLTHRTSVRYLAVGGSAFLVDLALLGVLHELVGLPVWLASGLAFVASFAYTYAMQRLAFRASSPHGGALARYLALVVVNTVATAGLVHGLSVTWLGWVGAKVIATGAAAIWNYFAYRHWVFGPDRASTVAPPEEA